MVAGEHVRLGSHKRCDGGLAQSGCGFASPFEIGSDPSIAVVVAGSTCGANVGKDKPFVGVAVIAGVPVAASF